MNHKYEVIKKAFVEAKKNKNVCVFDINPAIVTIRMLEKTELDVL